MVTAVGTAISLGALTGTKAAILGTTAVVAGAAGAGYLASKAMSPKMPSGQGMQMPQAPAAPKMEDASDKARLRAEERKRAMARSKSVVSNPLGIQDEANVARKKLLGG